MTELQCKGAAYSRMKQGMQRRNLEKLPMHSIRMLLGKAQLNWRLARTFKGKKKSFYFTSAING